MEHRNLGRAGLKVSAIGLGTHYFGWLHDAAASTAVIDRALELGISFIDTADVYDMGRSEEFVGKAIKGRRADLVIATKFGWPMGGGPSGAPVDPRPNARGGSRLNVIRAAEASLRRLGTDYIDLYQIHFPDPSTPIEETLRALDDLVRAGKVRYTGCSNFAAWQVSEAMWTSRCSNLNAFATSQPLYNLLQREIEQDHVPACGAARPSATRCRRRTAVAARSGRLPASARADRRARLPSTPSARRRRRRRASPSVPPCR